jgi:integrase
MSIKNIARPTPCRHPERYRLVDRAKPARDSSDLGLPVRGRRINGMNNNGWQKARREAQLPLDRVHDLRHTVACRLRAAGVSVEDREVLLGHANHSMAGITPVRMSVACSTRPIYC